MTSSSPVGETPQILGSGELERTPSAGASVAERVVGPILRLGVDGFGPFKGAEESARAALSGGRTQDQAVRVLIRSHVAVAGAQGFVTNIGGLVTLPVSMPANVGAAYLVQSHLAASIAAVYGHDPHEEEVRSALLLCLLGNGATEVLKKVGVDVGQKLAMTAIKRLPIEVIYAINRKVGFALLAKYGTKRSAVTLVKGVPLVGGVVGGSVDAVSTRAVGAFAKGTFATEIG